MSLDGGEFRRQALICRAMGSTFTAQVLEAAEQVLACGPRTAELIANWQGSRGEAAVGLRFAGGMHALARARANRGIVRLYRELDGDFEAVIGDTLAAKDDFMALWMRGAPQTNEVYRAAAIMAGLLSASKSFGGKPFELWELGSSGGLNLNLHRYGYDLGGVHAGEPDSPLQIVPEWRGPPPPDAPVRIVATRGVDIDPLDLTQEATRERLRAYVWPDQQARVDRLEAAFAIAEAHPPRIDRADGAAWLAERLAEAQDEGTARTVFHSIVLQYLSAEGRFQVREAMEEAGARASAARPLAWVSFEWDEARSMVMLTLTSWPGGETRLLATCHAHCAWIEWQEA